MAEILLIRHGENDVLKTRLAGRLPDVHLNEVGRQQAEAVAKHLGDIPIKAIYSSPLERTLETAAPLAKARCLTVESREGLLELDFGMWQGKTYKQLGRLKLWKVVIENPSACCFPSGESFVDAQRRVVNELEQINALYGEDDRVACFSHGDVIRLALAHYLGMPLNMFQRLMVNTASISTVCLKDGKTRVANINQTTS